ncbi:hypothetical protein CL614_06570 [archaeon]|jgi:hypothetical protein|nr:hypothetical protein [archaeon]|tara:strand:- start:718 stop:1005 length:288 start_codon:yes stop_codon:yes gene_type:complete
MDKNQRWQNGREYRRANDVAVKPETKDSLESIMTAAAAAGATDTFQMLFASLNKIAVQDNLAALQGEILNKLNQTLEENAKLRSMLAPDVEKVKK